MKILFTIRSLTGGGAERVVSVLSGLLADVGEDVHIITYKTSERDYSISEKVQIHEMPQRKDSTITKGMRIFDMRKIIKEIQPDVIIPFVGTVLYVSWLAITGMKIPFVLTIRNNPWTMPEKRLLRNFRDYLAKKSCAILVQNEEQSEYFSADLRKKCFVVPMAGYGAIGAGLPPYAIEDIVVVVKAYSSAVGAGAFVSEIFGDEAQEMRVRGGDAGEFGATTGRPRRMGWFDCVASRYGVQAQGATQAVLTVIDALGYLDEIPVCVGYEVDGKILKDFPTTPTLNRCKPVLEVLPGWKSDVRGIKKYEDLPENCRKYVEFIEKELGVPVTMVSNGPGRDELIVR